MNLNFLCNRDLRSAPSSSPKSPGCAHAPQWLRLAKIAERHAPNRNHASPPPHHGLVKTAHGCLHPHHLTPFSSPRPSQRGQRGHHGGFFSKDREFPHPLAPGSSP